MYKNQLQELAQRSCFNLPSYGCLREGPDHAPRFKATVKFNNEVFEGPGFCSTLRQAEHAVAEVALQELSKRGPAQSLAAKMLDETGVCKNLLQETTQKAGVPLPVYSSNRTGPGHLPVYICTVDVAGRRYSGQSAKTKKQAEKNAAAAAWAALKRSQNVAESESDELAQTAVVKALLTAPPEGDSELPSTSAEGPLFQEQIALPREPLRTSRLFGGVTGMGTSWQSAEYGLPTKLSERVKAEVAVGTSGAERAEENADVAEVSKGVERVGLPPAPAPFNLFSAVPFRQEWISPAEAKQAKAPSSPMALAPLVVPRALQAVYAKPEEGDDDDISDDESPTGKVLGELKKRDRPFG
ncbi:DRB5 dsRNA-binding protein 5 [Klebsormidium nitens]|uniref:DRB5 dsRNA-binding protein 5 n=1 Tax=Klebsormidium nitens TaxID=105231 RepID=A0A1Y1HWS7_KLENI|nr:DRB5 dsRNA-binding protein 5 [Klebsormidium nitens]|eukprot:GAQ81639.1 DRB5 dsRNA-binding protein 5 [Klebsormidium nitens]